jgi:hypothetical protein
VGPGLRQGIEVLEHSAVAVRSMFRAVLDATAEDEPDGWLRQDGADDVLLGLAQTLRELAAGVDAFGALVRGEAAPGAMSAEAVHELRTALEGMREARGRLEDLLASDADPALLELHASLLSTVKRIQQETDLEKRVRRQLQLWRTTRPRTRRPRPAPPRAQGAAPDDVLPDAETMPMPRLQDDDPNGR